MHKFLQDTPYKEKRIFSIEAAKPGKLDMFDHVRFAEEIAPVHVHIILYFRERVRSRLYAVISVVCVAVNVCIF